LTGDHAVAPLRAGEMRVAAKVSGGESELAGAGQTADVLVERSARAPILESQSGAAERDNGGVGGDPYRLIEQATAIHQALTRIARYAVSLQDIAEKVGRLLGRALTLEDPEGEVLGEWHPDAYRNPVRRATVDQGPVPAEILAELSRLGHLQAIHRSTGPLRLPALAGLGLPTHIACPVRLKDELVGVVRVIEGDELLNDLEMRAIENAAVVTALQIAHQSRAASAEAELTAGFLDTLLAGSFEPTANNLERGLLLGFSPEASHRAAIVVLAEPLPLSREGLQKRDRLAEHLRWQLGAQGAMAATSSRLRHVNFLLRATIDPASIWGYVKAAGLSMAVGRPYPGLEGTARSYSEARRVVSHLAPCEFRRYDELLIPRILDGDREARSDFLESLFGALDRARGGSLLRNSVLTFARHGFRRDEAALALQVHPSTLRYRLKRAAAVAGLELSDPETRFRLQLAAHLLSLPRKEMR
jgi:PucR family transcriptional regulator, purine catabolism regulatory protein